MTYARRNYRVCDYHFHEDAKFPENRNRTNLKYGSVPSLHLPGNQYILEQFNPVECQKYFAANDLDEKPRKERLKFSASPSVFESLESAVTTPCIPTVNALRKEDFPEICRFCLSRGNWPNILDLKFINIPLSEILSHVLCSHINLDDEMPKKICEACTNEITQFYTFKRGCEESQTILQSLLHTGSDHTENPFAHIERENYCDRSSVVNDFNTQNESCKVQNLSFVIDDDHGDIIIKEEDPTERNHTENSSPAEKDENNKANNCDSAEEQCFKNDTLILNSDLKDEPPLHCKTKTKLKLFKPKIYVCSCKKTFALRSEYLKHRQDFPPCRRCEICKICRKFIYRNGLKRHMRSHTKEQPFVCEFCSMRFSEHGNLKRHIMIHTGEKPYTCEYCDKAFNQSNSLKTHLLLHSRDKPYIPRKPKQFTSRDSDGSPFCKICNKVYSSRSGLAVHLLTHGTKDFLCSECGKSFYVKQALLSHSRIHTGEKPFCCHVCPRSFSQQSSLATHLKIHTGQKPFVCDVCGKRFIQSGHLNSHKKVHSRERPYSCSYCNKSFSHNGTLRVHVRTHTGETPYLCELCSKGFCDSTNLKKHMKKHKTER